MRRLVVILAIWAAGTGLALAQQGAISSTEIQPETIRLNPGFQRYVSIPGNATIASIHVGDPSVATVTAVSDRRFLINALSPDSRAQTSGQRATNVLVLDADQNVIANLQVEVGYSGIGTRIVEIHKRVGGGPAGGGARSDQFQGVEKYLCSPIKCDLVSRDKSEAPTQVIQQENYNTTSTKTK
ncbi:pilus assembly protein N-terminal domain-containing protein [Bradyrhizobium sp. 169]|uniref:pilus assembly protein N-terminal domain-containing protein n=1 Tax=Bradyrhizobium sp. 169 TaxID=2782640 RepID=UPI001FFBB4B9|nr:pilus assembly protein N-terminal domain-containing protein [Bradyrhizobium sp. 169]MCK1589199.1 pilus assembly protein N-terminal domain-containing protein [Bradyrhizobium sp. 169]